MDGAIEQFPGMRGPYGEQVEQETPFYRGSASGSRAASCAWRGYQ